MNTRPSTFPSSCTVQRPGFSVESSSGYWTCFTNAACAPFLASNGKTTCRTKKSSREPACPVYSPSCIRRGAAALGWPRHKDGRRTHAKSSLLQRTPRRKARSWCSKKALQRSAEETACTGGNQPPWQQEASDRDSWRSSVRKANCELKVERHKAIKEKRTRQKELAASLPSSSQTFVCPKCGRGCASRIGVYSRQRACKN